MAPKPKKAIDEPPANSTRAKSGTFNDKLKSGRKRATDFFDGEIGENAQKLVPRAKVPKAKTAEQTAEVEDTHPAKHDDPQLEPRETRIGDDSGAAEPSTPAKAKRGRPSKDKAVKPEYADKPTAPAEKKTNKATKSQAVEAGTSGKAKEPPSGKKSKATKGEAARASKSGDHPVQTEKTHPGGDRVEVETTNPAKGKKGQTKEGKPVETADDHHEEPAKPRKKASKVAEKDEADKDISAESQGRSKSAGQATNTETRKKGKKAQVPSKKGDEDADNAPTDPDMAMGHSVFDSLLATDKGKEPVDEGSASTEKSKPGKATNKASKEPAATAKSAPKSEKKAKDTSKTPASAEASTSKLKKRKAPAGQDMEAVKTDVLDPLSEMASAKKKQKISEPSALEAVGSYIGSTVDSAKKKAKAVMGYAGDVTASAQDSIMDDVTGLANGAVEEKQKKKRSKATPKSKAGDVTIGDEQGQAEDEDDTFFADTAYLAGFESSGDDRDGSDIDFPSDTTKSIPPLDRKTQAKAIKAASSTSGPGYVYIGRIPHGFYEHQMRAYFSQFGTITRLRLSRNRTTGHSKHFAFLEFQSEEVAKIVAATMDNYLLFGHILKVKLVPQEQLHPDTFKGANKRFVPVPWAKIQGRQLAMPKERGVWEKKIEKEKEKRSKKAEKLKDIGYEFEAPLKGVESVPIKGKKGVEDVTVEEEEQTLITQGGEGDGSLVVEEVKKVKRAKGKGKEVVEEAAVTATVKKGKGKVEESLEKAQDTIVDGTGSVAEPAAKKAKKGRDKAAEAISEKVASAPKDSKKTAEKVTKGKQ